MSSSRYMKIQFPFNEKYETRVEQYLMHNGSNKTALFERHSKQLNNNAIWERYLLCKCRNEGVLDEI